MLRFPAKMCHPGAEGHLCQSVCIAGISTEMLRFFPQRLIAVSCILKKRLKESSYNKTMTSLHISHK